MILAVENVEIVESVEESNKVGVDKEVLENTMSEIKYLAKPLVNKYNRIIKLEERKYELTKRYPEGNIRGLQKCIKECEKLESINELNDDFYYSFEMICNSLEDWLEKFILEKEKYFYCRELKAKEEATEENNDTTSVPEGTFVEDVDFKVEKTPEEIAKAEENKRILKTFKKAKRRAYF